MMSLDEKCELLYKSYDAEERGDFEEAERIHKMIPCDAKLAMAFKEVHGAEGLKNSGLNLTEAEEVYGKDWLEK